MADDSAVRIEPWAAGDLPILRRLLGDPQMTVCLGGPECDEKLIDRQARFEQIGDTGTGRMFKIIDQATGEAVGSVGYWETAWRDTWSTKPGGCPPRISATRYRGTRDRGGPEPSDRSLGPQARRTRGSRIA